MTASASDWQRASVSPLKAAALSLIGNTAPVAFGSIATPIVTLSAQTELPIEDLGAMVGRQTPFLALIVPLILVGVVDGARGVRQTWPAALVAGVTFAIAQFVCSNYISVELTDIIAALVSTIALVGFLRVWKPSEPMLGEPTGGPSPAIAGATGHDPALERSVRLRNQSEEEDSTREKLEAYAPYLIIVVVFALAKLVDPIEQFLFEFGGGTGFGTDEQTPNGFDWPGLNVIGDDGEAPSAQTFQFSFWDTPGTIVLFCGLLTIAALRINLRDAFRAYGATLEQLKFAIVTVMAVLALAYVMNLTGMTTTLGRWIAGSGDRLRLPLADHRLAGRCDHRLRHVLERAVRRPAGGGGQGGRPVRGAARVRQQLRRRARQDDLAAEPCDRRGGGGDGRQGGRHLPTGAVLEHRADPLDVRHRLLAIDLLTLLDGCLSAAISREPTR